MKIGNYLLVEILLLYYSIYLNNIFFSFKENNKTIIKGITALMTSLIGHIFA